jgi:hypothetical protein
LCTSQRDLQQTGHYFSNALHIQKQKINYFDR